MLKNNFKEILEVPLVACAAKNPYSPGKAWSLLSSLQTCGTSLIPPSAHEFGLPEEREVSVALHSASLPVEMTHQQQPMNRRITRSGVTCRLSFTQIGGRALSVVFADWSILLFLLSRLPQGLSFDLPSSLQTLAF